MEMSFDELFAGNETRHLTYDPATMAPRDDGKMVPKYVTVDRAVDDRTWASHLKGKASLGLSPLRDGKVKWGAVDVDKYPIFDSQDDLKALVKAWGDPCLVARTKSGGVHIIAFTKDWVSADTMRRYLEIKRDAVLTGDARKHAQEIFPKQSDGAGSQMNLPQFGQERPVLIWADGDNYTFCNTTTAAGNELGIDWERVHQKCFVSATQIEAVLLSALAVKPKAREQKEKPRWAGGFKRPTSGKPMEGRNSYLYSCAASARARGADDAEVEETIRAVNQEFANPSHVFGDKGPITDEARIKLIIEQVQKLAQGETKASFDAVEQMNQEWALMNVAGKVEFMNLKTSNVSNHESWSLLNAPRAGIAKAWLSDPDRLEYHDYVIEDPRTYDGRGYNVFRGHPIQPTMGDASLFQKYILEILCGGDAALAHWVTTYIADGVQRPWTPRPGTALALRGPQGSGKSFLGYAISKVLGDDMVLVLTDSDRMTHNFNRRMFAKTFLLGEESFFVGSRKQANILKNLVTAQQWTYEGKYLNSFEGKNVHRIIATTNESQAVHIDFDDRRWTVVQVNRACPFKSTSMEAQAWWAPYYDLVENRPGDVLRYLLEYPVDRDLIRIPHHTQAKAEDKATSEPLVALLNEIAHSGVCPDDLRGDGRIATATLAREVWARGGSRQTVPQAFANDVRKRYGAETAKNCADFGRTGQRFR